MDCQSKVALKVLFKEQQTQVKVRETAPQKKGIQAYGSVSHLHTI